MYIRNEKRQSYVRFLNASSTTGEVEIYVNGNEIFDDLSYENFTEYIPLNKGEYKIEIYANENEETPIIAQSLQIPENEVITVAIVGDMNNMQLALYTESNPKNLSQNESRLRFINLSTDSPALDIFIDNNKAYKDVGYLDATIYLDLPVGIYKADLFISGTKEKVLSLEVEVKDQKVYTIYLLGNYPKITYTKSLDGSSYIRY